MKTLIDGKLVTEAAHFHLRFSCDDCVHFAPERSPTCGQGWPERLRRGTLEAAAAEAPDAEGREEPKVVSFCKEFELA
jgi:hypothetical protein